MARGKPALSDGVNQEKRYASFLQIPVHYYQDPNEDPDGIAEREWGEEAKGLLKNPYYVNRYNSERELLESLE